MPAFTGSFAKGDPLMSDTFDFGGDIVWHPGPDYIERANLSHFMWQHRIQNYAELMRRSTEDPAWFTEAVLNFLDIRFQQPYSQVLNMSRGPAWPIWCQDAQLNITTNCLDRYLDTPAASRPALIWEGEEGTTRTLTYADLSRQVNQVANALRSLGCSKGDVIGLFMPMVPEIVSALLAIARIGAVILPLFSGYGPGAIATRLADANAKALFTMDGTLRRGKQVEMKSIVDKAAEQVPTLQHVIVLEQVGLDIPMMSGRDYWWQHLIENQPDACEAELTAAEDILMILYTSGTSGRPKGAVHTHCGFPIKAAQDMAFGTDVHPGDLIYWITDMGWMMGPWLVFGSLVLGATFLIYDGAPDYPGPDRLWALVARHRITTLGVSPTLVRALIPHGNQFFRKHDLSSLRFFASTGEPWNPAPWMWLFREVGEGRRPVINYSGGTEISGGIVMGNPLLPLKPCAFSAPCPGIAADIYDESGQSLRGQVGELVIKAPWIGMTRGFWGDPQRYLDTYWSRYPGVWQHGDFAAVDSDGMWYILGRSDDTIKVAGKRLGPAEIESLMVQHPTVIEAAAIGVPDEIKGNALVVYCVLAVGCGVCEELRQELYQHLVNNLGKSLAPKAIYFVSDLPKTRNAKVMRRMIRAAYLGEDPGDTSSLVNPEAVEEIRRAL